MMSASIGYRGQRLKADLTLLLVAAVWGSAFVVCRLAAAQTGSFLYNGSRFLLGALTLLPLVAARLRGLARVEVWGGALAGALLFAASGLQQLGLQFTTAGKAGFITGLYVILVPFFLALVWWQWPRGSTWVAPCTWELPGVRTSQGLLRYRRRWASFCSAPWSTLRSRRATAWSSSGRCSGRCTSSSSDDWRRAWTCSGLPLGSPRGMGCALMQYVVCALLSLAAGLMFELSTAPGLVSAWWAVLYTGIFSVGLGYTLQVVGQQHAPAADAAVILSGEAVFAALAGWLVLGERLAPWQLLGCALMLAGMILAQASPWQVPGATWRQGGQSRP